ncbi:MAG: TIR domain-containing protein [Bacteroidota bacterium]|nr:TIR domain-containing protein [Bacteroidota bacterium]MDP4192054.1 TIR domain-containing protein [Bacteroidota bacterium]MDP4194474.1 TIR domain-containing protein [Bacteroidota bacterium]
MKIYISYANRDIVYSEFIKKQDLNTKIHFKFLDMSNKKPWDEKWRAECSDRINQCKGVIALISNNTDAATGAKWEIDCAKKSNKPIIGVRIHKDEPENIPPELGDIKIINWRLCDIAEFIDTL